MQEQRPLSGIKVLGLTRVYAAPFAAYQLALNGAEVINVEDPGDGDTTRTAGAEHAKRLIERKMAAPFLAHGAGKKSLTLNLRTAEGREIFRKLARDSDVLIENLRSGSMDALGLGYEDIRKINPRVIYCSLTGYGQTGPKRRDPATDPVIQAASGLMSINGKPESGPVKVGTTMVDYAAGFSLTTGILMALLHRERTGQGQLVDVSLLETALVMMSATVSDVMNAGYVTKLKGNKSGNFVSDVFECGDGRHIMIAASKATLRQRLWKALGRIDIPTDDRFKDVDSMRANSDALYAEITRTTKTKSAAEWEGILNEAGTPCMKINSIAEIVEHPQIKERKLYHTFESVPGLDQKVSVPLACYKLSACPARVDIPPPVLGAHTEEILKGLGYTEPAISAFRASGVI